jgi:UDP-N-acetylglucosamine transferase subunit ALG13
MAKPLVLVTVGTDHHRFDRLIGWVDEWLSEGGKGKARCFVQCGTSGPPSNAPWTAFLSYDELQVKVSEAASVVCHGGPATIMECRRHGLIPIVVPRKRELGEHVDDHQGLFTARLSEQGEISLVSDRDGLWRLLDSVVANPTAFRGPPVSFRVEDTVKRFSSLVEGLVIGS